MKSIIQTPTRNLQESLEFYEKLNFKVISKANPTVVTDGKAIIEINADRHARAGLKLFKKDWSSFVQKLPTSCPVVSTEKGYLIADISGMWIYLINGEFMPKSTFEKDISSSTLGNYSGLCIETVGFNQSVELLNSLGFAPNGGGEEQGWQSLKNKDGIIISVMKPNMCPHLFFNPSLTYFNGENNLGIIDAVRQQHIPFVEEITHFNKEGKVDNVIIKDPGGLGIFLFND